MISMIFTPIWVQGVFVIEPELHEDERGFFARTFCQNEFATHGLKPVIAQSNISFNRRAGTLRGMHYQAAPYEEAKLVRCTRGVIYDVALDLRPTSPTYRQWFAVELSAENRKMLYIPEGLAHGFQSLIDNTEVLYQMSEFYHPEAACGVRWNDPAFEIKWPISNPTLSYRDQSYTDW